MLVIVQIFRNFRDKAILLIGFMGAFRRSEIAALTVENLSFLHKALRYCRFI